MFLFNDEKGFCHQRWFLQAYDEVQCFAMETNCKPKE
jgi:hypothetical protein